MRCLFARWLMLVGTILAVVRACHGASVRDEDVRAAIAALSRSIVKGQNADGSWEYPGYPVGMTALMVLALRQSGMSIRDDPLLAGVEYLLDSKPRTTYGEGLLLCALEPWGGKARVRPRLQKALDFLCAIQGNHGGWSYKAKSHGYDFSNTQFAVLGLGAAQRLGMDVPDKVRNKTLDLWLDSQNGDGGWGYTARSPSRLSMGCAGVASLNLLGVALERPGQSCGRYEYNRDLQKGLEYIGKQLKRDGLGRQHWGHYTWYALERVAIFLDLKTIGRLDWYRAGAADMVEVARRPGATPNHAFALLFLAKAATPVAVAKWKWNGDWNNDHHDVRNWLRHSSVTLDRPFDWVVAELRTLDSPAAKASLLYASGHKRFRLRLQEAEFVRAFLKDGGTLVAEPCCNRKEFAKSFAKELCARLYPGLPGRFVRLPVSHEVYTVKHQLTGKQIGVYQLRLGGCRRKRVFLLDRDIGCALNGDPGTERRLRTARKVADNLLAYALRVKQPKGKLNEVALERAELPMVALTAPEMALRREGGAAQFRCPLGRLKHRGDWQADPHFFESATRVLSEQKSVPDFDGEIPVDPATTVLFSVPVLFANGHNNPDLRPAEVANLRMYLQSGGALVVSSCCSSPEFDRGFRALVAQTLPNDRLEEIPPGDAIWQKPFDLRGQRPQGNDAFVRKYPRRWGPLLGVRREGRWVVLYSPVDFCCAYEGDLEDEVVGYDLQAGSRLLTNLLAELMRIE
ncbi:MAG: DUF4159 domain-containing protein [Victivallales bacterium]|nr:DUF4159 domain-containing protein [Victivallales bacterium]